MRLVDRLLSAPPTRRDEQVAAVLLVGTFGASAACYALALALRRHERLARRRVIAQFNSDARN